jgi:hypothetical protein
MTRLQPGFESVSYYVLNFVDVGLLNFGSANPIFLVGIPDADWTLYLDDYIP